MGIVGIQSSATASSAVLISSYTMLRKAIPKPAAAVPSLHLCRKKPNLSFSLVARSMGKGEYPVPPEVSGTGTPPEFPTKRTNYPTPPIPPEVPELPKGPEIEINPGRELTTQPPGIPEVPNPFPGRGPDFPVPPMPSPPTGPPDFPSPQPPDQLPPRVPPDPDILPPNSTPPDILPPDLPPGISPPPGPSILFS